MKISCKSPDTPWAISAKVSLNGYESQIGTGLDPEKFQKQTYRRITNIQGKTYKTQSILSEHIQALWLTPQMDRLFIDGSKERRRFLDRLVYNIDTTHSTRLNNYDHQTRERMRLLKEGSINNSWLNVLEEQISNIGVAIEISRLQIIEILRKYLKKSHGFFPEANIELKSDLKEWIEILPAVKVEEKFKENLFQNRFNHASTCKMNIGIQRSDLITIFTEKNMPASFCSTEEQKSLLISLVLASARYLSENSIGVPLLLLDEIVAHLDEDSRSKLFKELKNLNIQTWMTGTDSSVFEKISNKNHFFIKDGKII